MYTLWFYKLLSNRENYPYAKVVYSVHVDHHSHMTWEMESEYILKYYFNVTLTWHILKHKGLVDIEVFLFCNKRYKKHKCEVWMVI